MEEDVKRKYPLSLDSQNTDQNQDIAPVGNRLQDLRVKRDIAPVQNQTHENAQKTHDIAPSVTEQRVQAENEAFNEMYAPVTEEAEVVRMIYRWYADGMSIRGIENKLDDLKIPSPSGAIWRDTASVSVILNNWQGS